jgi:hypothetical protein
VSQFKYLGTTVTNQNQIQEEISQTRPSPLKNYKTVLTPFNNGFPNGEYKQTELNRPTSPSPTAEATVQQSTFTMNLSPNQKTLNIWDFIWTNALHGINTFSPSANASASH